MPWSGSMAFAYFVTHAPHGVLPIDNGGEQAALYCWILLLIAAVGPGALALDAIVARRRSSGRAPAHAAVQPVAG